MSDSGTSRSAPREIEAPASRVFDLLVTPSEHHRLDASAMVGDTVISKRLTSVGDVFTMEMTYRSGAHVEHYRTDNHVTALDEGRCVEWAVAPHGEAPLGWRWRYELEPRGPHKTEVALVYDWTGTPEENMVRYGVPLFDESQLVASLARLAEAVEGA
ncbi:MAG: hypothetical protein ACRDP4_06945 [Nocardioidaceae bacterium]